jgi:hypothetical protein
MAAFIIIAIALIMIVYSISILSKRKDDQKNLDLLISESGLTFVQLFKFKGKMDCIGIDEKNRKILIIHQFSLQEIYESKKGFKNVERFDKLILDFDQVLKSEIVVDGNTVTSKSTSRTLGGALIGGALLGGVGAIVGGLSGGSSNNSYVKNLSLRLVINSLSKPNFYINFFDSRINTGSANTKVDSNTYKSAFNECQKFHDIISIIIDQEDKKTA